MKEHLSYYSGGASNIYPPYSRRLSRVEIDRDNMDNGEKMYSYKNEGERNSKLLNPRYCVRESGINDDFYDERLLNREKRLSAPSCFDDRRSIVSEGFVNTPYYNRTPEINMGYSNCIPYSHRVNAMREEEAERAQSMRLYQEGHNFPPRMNSISRDSSFRLPNEDMGYLRVNNTSREPSMRFIKEGVPIGEERAYSTRLAAEEGFSTNLIRTPSVYRQKMEINRDGRNTPVYFQSPMEERETEAFSYEEIARRVANLENKSMHEKEKTTKKNDKEKKKEQKLCGPIVEMERCGPIVEMERELVGHSSKSGFLSKGIFKKEKEKEKHWFEKKTTPNKRTNVFEEEDKNNYEIVEEYPTKKCREKINNYIKKLENKEEKKSKLFSIFCGLFCCKEQEADLTIYNKKEFDEKNKVIIQSKNGDFTCMDKGLFYDPERKVFYREPDSEVGYVRGKNRNREDNPYLGVFGYTEENDKKNWSSLSEDEKKLYSGVSMGEIGEKQMDTRI